MPTRYYRALHQLIQPISCRISRDRCTMTYMAKLQKSAIEISRISKSYGSTKAVKSTDLSIPQGTLYALIGPNGAGKSTIMKMIVGLLRQDKGTIRIFDEDTIEKTLDAKSMLSYISDDPTPYDYLSGMEFIELTARLRGLIMEDALSIAKRLIKLFKLEKMIRQPVSQYSRGSRQKVAFIAAMISNPQILVIDEPIVGLDPGSIDVFGEELLAYVKKGGTVLLATHILSFAAKYADRVAVMFEGQVVIERAITENTNLERIYELAMQS